MSPFKGGLVAVAAAAVLFVCLAGAAKNQAPKQVLTAPASMPSQVDGDFYFHRPAPPTYLPVVEKKGMKMQMEMSYGPEADSITIHVSERLTEHSIERWEGSMDRPDNPQTPLARDLFAIKGISEVVFYPYEIHLSKGRMFSWDELRPAVTEAVFNNLGKPLYKKASGGSILPGNPSF